jgi:hypothetical protein
VIKPTIHLNGTSPGVLLEDLIRAADALRDAMQALRLAAPNARDYYPQGPKAIAQAAMEHAQRMDKLQGVLRELEELAEHE